MVRRRSSSGTATTVRAPPRPTAKAAATVPPPPPPPPPPDFDILGARVDQSGAVLDPGGIARLDGSAPIRSTLRLLSTARTTWSPGPDSRHSSYANVYGASVTPGGLVMDSAGIPIATARPSSSSPPVASEGGQSLVAWQDDRGAKPARTTSMGLGYAGSGHVLDPAGIAVSAAPYSQGRRPRLRRRELPRRRPDARSEYPRPDLYGARVTPSGSALEPDGLVFSATGRTRAAIALARGASNSALLVYSRIGSSLRTAERSASSSASSTKARPPATASAGRAAATPATPATQPPPPPEPPPPPATSATSAISTAASTGALHGAEGDRSAASARPRHGSEPGTAPSVASACWARSRRVGRVIAQSPRPGRTFARGSRVNLVLGRR